ncbi:unnamed protein product [Sympodiomycopsis kandeliae]
MQPQSQSQSSSPSQRSSSSSSSLASSAPSLSHKRSPLPMSSLSWYCLVALLSCLLPTSVVAQANTQNVTQLTGTWVSGAAQVMTGLQFFNPVKKNFTIPSSGGIAYSFLEDLPNGGHFETSTFTFTSNPTSNRCFKAALTWQHGTFTNNANGSLSLKPFAADGMVQVMDPCAAVSVQLYPYSQFELIPSWYNYLEPDTGFSKGPAYALRMFSDDGTGNSGAPKSIMNLVRRPPTMLPPTQLHQEVLNAAGADS